MNKRCLVISFRRKVISRFFMPVISGKFAFLRVLTETNEKEINQKVCFKI